MASNFKKELSNKVHQCQIEVVFADRSMGCMLTQELWSGSWMHGTDLILEISESRKYPPRRLGSGKWSDDYRKGEVNCGLLFHGFLRPRSDNAHQLGGSPFRNGRSNNTNSTNGIEVAVKWVHGPQAVQSLRSETVMYEGPLRKLQGFFVPTMYGMFSGREDGTEVGCMVMEWCPGNDSATRGRPSPEKL